MNAALALHLYRTWKARCEGEDGEDDAAQAGVAGGAAAATPSAAPAMLSGFELTEVEAAGLAACTWPGRCQVEAFGPKIRLFLDGAHTTASCGVCADWFSSVVSAKSSAAGQAVRRVLFFNCAGDRRPEDLLAPLVAIQEHCGFEAAFFCPNLTYPAGQKFVDQVNRMVLPDEQQQQAEANARAWGDGLAGLGGRWDGGDGDGESKCESKSKGKNASESPACAIHVLTSVSETLEALQAFQAEQPGWFRVEVGGVCLGWMSWV